MRAIGPPLTAEESAAFVDACRSFKGVPFRHMGRNPKIGLDCAGLPQAAIKVVGRPLFDLVAYGREPHKDGLRMAMVANLGPPVLRASMRAADVVLMRLTPNGPVRHVGVLSDHPDGVLGMIHVHEEIKFVCEHRIDERRMAMITEVWRP